MAGRPAPLEQHARDRRTRFVGPPSRARCPPACSMRAGGDGIRADAPLQGEITVSADIADADILRAERAFREAGARNVLAR